MTTAKELRERLAYVTEYEFRQPPQSAREHAMALATAKAHWKQIAYDAILALEERERGCDEAWREANNALYFDDNSDYGTSLFAVCHHLKPEREAGSSFADTEETNHA